MTLLAPDDIRGFQPDTDLSDESIQILLDAAEAEIIRYAGPVDSLVEWHVGGQRVIALSRPATEVTSVVEHYPWDSSTTWTMDATDYIVDPTGYLLYRQGGGTSSRWSWYGRVAVTYAPTNDDAIRKGVVADLVGLMITYHPGANSETVGSWTTQLSSSATWNNDTEREAILSRLVVHGRMAVV